MLNARALEVFHFQTAHGLERKVVMDPELPNRERPSKNPTRTAELDPHSRNSRWDALLQPNTERGEALSPKERGPYLSGDSAHCTKKVPQRTCGSLIRRDHRPRTF